MKCFLPSGQQEVIVCNLWEWEDEVCDLTLLPQPPGAKQRGPGSHTEVSRQGLEFGGVKAANFKVNNNRKIVAVQREGSGDP